MSSLPTSALTNLEAKATSDAAADSASDAALEATPKRSLKSPLGEFDLIERYFKRHTGVHTTFSQPTVVLGIGDDCALLSSTPGHHWAVSTDSMVEGRHFFPDVDPVHLGHKALAVNLSDLAACGATPRCFTLGLTLPHVDESWLSGFSEGLFALADQYGCVLVGGDTTQGLLNIAITVMGEVPQGQALRRSGARVGDDLWVSGTLGDARLGLEALLGERRLSPQALQYAQHRLECPTPRVALGLALRGLASSAMDLSDGLLGDLGHLLKSSGLGAQIETHWIDGESQAISPWLQALSLDDRRSLVLSGGDDYELLFTAPVSARDAVLALSREMSTPLTRIGVMVPGHSLRVLDAQGHEVKIQQHSYEHFS